MVPWQFVPERYPARQAIFSTRPLFVCCLFYTRARRDGRNTPTYLFAKGLPLTRDTFIEENRRNHWKWNSFYSRRTAPHHSNDISRAAREQEQYPDGVRHEDSRPSLVNDLCSILLRFRVHKIAFSTDIEKAFLHVKLDTNDQDFTRFLWLSNPNDAESDFDTYRFKVVLFGSASSPFMLGATLHLHLSKYNSQIAHDMQQNLYVDNVISGRPTEASAIEYFNEARKIMSDANFNLRSWASNSQPLQAIARDSQVIDENQLVNVLGLYWNTTEDRIYFIPKPLDSTSSSVVTKRSILQDSSRVYDPLGILSPVTIRAKLLMQELWQQFVDWDEPLDQRMRDKWRDTVTDF